MRKNRCSESSRGIALIQVLIITIVLSLLAVFISQTVKRQVNLAMLIDQNVEATLHIESVESELIFALLTHRRLVSSGSEDPIVSNWNFHGEPFNVDENTQVEIQDLSGLLSLNYLKTRATISLFRQLGVAESDYRVFLDSLKDWKDADNLSHLNGAEEKFYINLGKLPPRNDYLQSVEEVVNIRGADILTEAQWKKFFTTELISKFNPLNAPPELLEALLVEEEVFNQVSNLRDSKNLNGVNFLFATGIEENEVLTFRPGRVVNVVINYRRQGLSISKAFNAEIRPNLARRPITISNIKWNTL